MRRRLVGRPLGAGLAEAGHGEGRGCVAGDLLHAAAEALELQHEQPRQPRVGHATPRLVVTKTSFAPVL